MTAIKDIKVKFQQVLGFQELPTSQVTPSFVRQVLQNRSHTLMQALALETKGKDFWNAVDMALSRISQNKQTRSQSREAMPQYQKVVIHSFVKEPSAWRIRMDAAYFAKLAELQQQYPLGELVGDIHERQDFVILR